MYTDHASFISHVIFLAENKVTSIHSLLFISNIFLLTSLLLPSRNFQGLSLLIIVKEGNSEKDIPFMRCVPSKAKIDFS